MRILCKTLPRLGLATQQGVITVVIVVVLLLWGIWDCWRKSAEEFVPVTTRVGPVIRFAHAMASGRPVVAAAVNRKCCDSRTTHNGALFASCNVCYE